MSLLLIIILLIVLRCILIRTKLLSSSNNQVDDPAAGRHLGDINRTQLDEDMPYFTSLTTVAPPSYQDALRID